MESQAIVSSAVKILRNQYKNKKISSETVIKVLDNMDGIDDDFEITDEIIDEILAAYKKPPDPVDEEKLSLQLANKRFNQNVKGIIDITKDDDVDEDDDWVPSVAIDTKTQLEWEKIQDKLDKIKNKFEEMTSL